MRYRNHSITNVGKVRSANEDNYGDANTPNGHLFVVCDGMGGHVGGAKASSIAVASIVEYFQREKHSNLIQAIDRAFSFANEQIFANAISSPELKGMGTTAVVLLISDDNCYIGHVGDSRIYLKSNSKLHRITKDHSFVQTLVDSGVISDDEAESHPNKNQILKALGTSSVVEGTICQMPIQVKAGDVFLLCSDGLNGMVNDKGLEMMLQEQDLLQSGDDLMRAALDAGGLDNITATMVAIDENSYLSSKFINFNPVQKFDGGSTQVFNTNNNSKQSSTVFTKKGIFLLSVLTVFVGIMSITFLGGQNSTSKDPSDYEGETPPVVVVVHDGGDKADTVTGGVKSKPKPKPKPEPTAAHEKAIKYKVKQGDNLGSITAKFKSRYPGLTQTSIISYNQKNNIYYKDEFGEKLESNSEIRAGKDLLIPTE